MSMTALYALFNGIPVGNLTLGGIGYVSEPPPFSGCFPVYITSDSQGKFGHDCPRCKQYWRSGASPSICPYCGLRGHGYQFLSNAQRKFVRLYCELLCKAEEAAEDAVIEIDMNEVAEAVGKGEKPAFYVSEKSQQRKFTCTACGEFNDILGRFGYCSLCGTRNDIAEFEAVTIPAIRNRLNADALPQDCVRDAVAAFDSLAAQYAKQLALRIPLMPERQLRLTSQAFHKLAEIRLTFNNWFGIDISKGMKEPECAKVSRMFFRRHVYEHNGGEVDQKYIDESGDGSVSLKQSIRETKEDAHELLGSLVKMARNLHVGFHCLIPPLDEPIKYEQDKKKRISDWAKQ